MHPHWIQPSIGNKISTVAESFLRSSIGWWVAVWCMALLQMVCCCELWLPRGLRHTHCYPIHRVRDVAHGSAREAVVVTTAS